ncbi:MAG: carbohydrate-binding family 9-like protein [Smithellaceae bacterium]|nr:carbohydrate-binding family 9-like protein [Smithellaceae bacterium]
MNQSFYKIVFTHQPPEMQGGWQGAVWRQAPSLSVDCRRPEGSSHHPRTLCKLFYDDRNIYGIFRVEDQYVRSVHTAFQSDVWKDSCVEFFVQPKVAGGYFNFEFNCGGVLLPSHVTNPMRVNGRLKEFHPLVSLDDRQIRRFSTLGQVVELEIPTPIVWHLEFAIPFAVLEKYTGPLGAVTGQVWRANFCKCGNETSHPHWLSWSPLRERNFHDPASFGSIEFC